MTKRTYSPSKIKRKRTYGYRARKKTRDGQKVLKRRTLKKRKRIALS
ncbi:MAG: 50S ribosomal protein L34 [Candidatus Pacebacteria bacterium]|nr:50S ribosomal protein L34 [Candidatus Paceibacterota bacterium]